MAGIGPRLTISGLRGIWGTELTEQVAYEYALAFGKLTGAKKVIIGRDGRKSGPEIYRALFSAFSKLGIEVENVGIIPTPTILLISKKMSLPALIITASHNPIEYNGLKFVMDSGLFAVQDEINKIESFKNTLSAEEKVYSPIQAPIEPDNKEFRQIHISEILKNIDSQKIREKKFKVALDPINASGAVITKELLEELGCETYVINEEQTGEFNHEPEPRVENISELHKVVVENKCDIGFVQDPDADRLLIITDTGEILSEEYTLALSAMNVLSKTPGDMVVNMSTSNLNKDITEKYSSVLHRTPVGELNVVAKIRELGAVIGGEGNGGAIYPTINTARDSLVGIALILELMANENKKVSEITGILPKYIMRKDKISFSGDLSNLYASLKEKFKDAQINEEDGVRFDWPDSSWVHLRPSNTEPVVRIIGEATTSGRLDALFEAIRLTLGAK